MYKIKLSLFQKIFFNDWQIDPKRSDYNIVSDQFLYGDILIDKLRLSIKKFVSKYVLFNSQIEVIDDEPCWVPSTNKVELEFLENPISDRKIYKYVTKPFNLNEGGLYRFLLIKYSVNEYRFIVVFHHILVSSFAAENSVFASLINYYKEDEETNEHTFNDQISLLSLFANKLNILVNENLKLSKKFWHKKLHELEILDLRFLTLHSSFIRNKDLMKYNINEIRFTFDKNILIQTNIIARKYRITPYLYGQIVLACLLYRYTAQEKFAISYPFAIREGSEFIYGAQINTSLIVYDFEQAIYFSDIVIRVKEFIQEVKNNRAFDYRYCPVSEIVDVSNKGLLDVAFIQTNLKDTIFKFNTIESVKINNDFNIDLNNKLLFEQEIRDKKINFRVKFNSTQIDNNLLINFINCYQRLYGEILEGEISSNVKKQLSEYNLLSSETYNKIILGCNGRARLYPQNQTLHQLFENQVTKTPNNIAVCCGDRQLTYDELNCKSNQLAHYICSTYQVQENDLVGICLEKDEHLIIAIFAVLKSGAAYVPIDISYSDDRISYILIDTQAKILITNRNHQNKLDHILAHNNMAKEFNPQLLVLVIDDYNNNLEFVRQNTANKSSVRNDKLAYVIYTSGTTGNPKGVMIEHRNLVAFILGFIKHPLNSELPLDMLSTTNYVFDIFGLEYMLPLLNGYTMYLVDLFNLSNKLDLKKYDCIQITPSKVKLFIDSIDYNNQDSSNHKIKLFVGGEILNQATIQELYSLNLKLSNSCQIGIEVINLYGPTETTIWSTAKKIDFKHISNNIGNIGRPLINQCIYILDNNLNILPIGAIGEIYIGGSGLARGYLNQLKLTTDRFIVNPFQNMNSKCSTISDRLYKTGDLARYLPDGSIEYIGRNDFQVKIRGHRIELNEIENVLNSYPTIECSVILVKNKSDHNDYIVAYYISNAKINDELLTEYLLKYLPYYMIPKTFIHINKIPLNANGKLDIYALPDPNFVSSANYHPPRSELEKEIIKVWAEVLELSTDTIGMNDNFYQLGGNSILIIQLKNRLAEIDQFRNITIADLFRYTTIQQLVKFVEQDKANGIVKILKHKPTYETDIAIISMTGAFSGCDTIDQYWDLIYKGLEGVSVFTIDECRKIGVSETLLRNPSFVPVSGHIPNVDKFDAAFWRISPNEAKNLDPHIRKFLESCWYLLEDSGYIKNRSKLNIGVFAGGSYSRYKQDFFNDSNPDSIFDMWTTVSIGVTSSLSTKVSHLMGLTGPSININTACSTSLVAIIEACQKLTLGDCDLAIAGGASLLMPNEVGYVYQDDMIFSKDGHCRAFDSKASGILIGSGVGAVLLKRLADAKKDKDPIIAVIKGYAINNDGNRKISYTAPSEVGQTECIVNAQKMAKITSDMVDYVECHGTGTSLGDPIEIKALNNAFQYNINKNKDINSCVVGSVKANIGHTDVAAGIAGVIKVCKMLEHSVIPKQINYDQPNPNIHLEKTNFEIIATEKKWNKKEQFPRIAGISSFGIGGTNAHIIIAENKTDELLSNDVNKLVTNSELTNYILPMSAKSPSSLNLYKDKFIRYLENTSDRIEDIVYTLQNYRDFFDFRISIVCNSNSEAIKKLQNSNLSKAKTSTQPQDIIFMFPGQGNQYANMSLQLYKNVKEYKDTLDKCICLVNLYTKVSFEEVLFPELSNKVIDYDIDQTKWAQIALFIVSFSLAKLLEEHLNIKPTAYIGHSVGELVAATLSGVFSLENAIKLVVRRSQLMQSMPKGSMLAIFSDISTIRESIRNSGCEISVINSPKNYVTSGTKQQIIDLKGRLDKIGVTSVILKVSHAYHSSSMNNAAKEFIDKFVDISMNPPTRKFISNLTGDFITANDAINPDYWAAQIRSQVLFADGVINLLNKYSNPFFIEVGTGKSLLSAVKNISNNPDSIYGTQLLNSLKENDVVEDIHFKEDIISKLWLNGYTTEFSQYYTDIGKSYNIVKLPNYYFEKKTYWLQQTQYAKGINLQMLPEDEWLNVPIWKKIANLSLIDKPEISNEYFLIFVEKEYAKLDYLIPPDNKALFVRADQIAKDFTFINDTCIIINPIAETAYQSLAEYLKKNTINPSVIIHANTLSINSFEDNKLKIEQHLNYGFYSLFLIQQYILSKLSDVKFLILTQEIAKIAETDIVNPYNGAMVGALRAIKHEVVNVKSSILDVGSFSSHTCSQIIDFIKNDANFIQEKLYALKFQSLWVQSFEHIQSSHKELTIESGDIILITGGLGGIGLSIAKIISKKNNVTLILASRNDIRDIRKPNQYVKNQLSVLEKIELSGSKVEVQCWDISDIASVENLITYIIKTYGRLSGIIHAAGLPPLTSDIRSFDTIKMAMQAKIYGVHNLSIVTKSLRIKYFIMMSSLASVMGDVNRIEYCAANSYLDYVPDSNLLHSHYKLTINWPGWSDVGMIVKYKKYSENLVLNNITKLNSVTKTEGAELFYDLTQYKGHSQIVLSKLNLELLTHKLFRTNTAINLTMDNIIDRVLEDDLPTLYYKIASIFLELLSLDHISIYDSFFNLGGTSLSAIKLISQLKEIHINLTLTEVVNINSIDAIYKLYENNMLKGASDRILVPLCINNSSDKNVFFIHAVGGSVIFYLNMVRKLSRYYNYYGIQNINISGKQLIKVSTLEELAAIYLSEILKIQPDGEYILMGASLGGTISYEIAKQLIKSGKRVKYIVMFDSWAIFSSHFKDEKVFKTIMEDQVEFDKSSKNFGYALDYDALANARWELMKLLLNYQPQRANIDIYLYKAKDVDKNYATIGEYNDNGWQQYTDKKVTTYKISGSHTTMHLEPGLHEMLNLLNISLNVQESN